jgi:hypothetical protein
MHEIFSNSAFLSSKVIGLYFAFVLNQMQSLQLIYFTMERIRMYFKGVQSVLTFGAEW